MGSSSNSASREAQQQEDQRRREVAATQAAIDRIYGSPEREQDRLGLVAATRDFLTKDLDKQNQRNQRQLKFALARSGQSFGSVDVDQNRELAQQYLRGGLEVERRAQSAGNSLLQADQAARQNLYGLASAGIDLTTATRNAGLAMRSDLAGVRSDALQSGLGDVFQQFGDIYKDSRAQKAKRDQDKQFGFAAPSAFGPFSAGYAYPGG